ASARFPRGHSPSSIPWPGGARPRATPEKWPTVRNRPRPSGVCLFEVGRVREDREPSVHESSPDERAAAFQAAALFAHAQGPTAPKEAPNGLHDPAETPLPWVGFYCATTGSLCVNGGIAALSSAWRF